MSDEPKITVEGLGAAPEIFAEGWTHLYYGFPLVKIVLHTVTDPNPSNEVRKVAATVTLPMLTAIQLAQTILAASKANAQVINQFMQGQQVEIEKLLKELPTIKAPADPSKTEK